MLEQRTRGIQIGWSTLLTQRERQEGLQSSQRSGRYRQLSSDELQVGDVSHGEAWEESTKGYLSCNCHLLTYMLYLRIEVVISPQFDSKLINELRQWTHKGEGNSVVCPYYKPHLACFFNWAPNQFKFSFTNKAANKFEANRQTSLDIWILIWTGGNNYTNIYRFSQRKFTWYSYQLIHTYQ